MREWMRNNPDKVRNTRLKGTYGITLEQYAALLAQQNNQCAICGAPPGDARSKHLHVDHCHISNKVRGLLCGNCNNGLGQFQDDVALLLRAVEYLKN